MTNNTGSSYSDEIESSIDQELSLEQWNKLRYSNAKVEELLDTGFSLSSFYRGLYWGGIFALTSVLSAIVGASLTHFQPISETITNLLVEYNPENSSISSIPTESNPIPRLTKPVNLLIVGINSKDNSSASSASVLLFRFQPQDNFVTITSIPQDSRVEIPDRGFGTIQEAHSHGGIKMVSQVVSKTLDNIEIDRYIKATPTTLFKLIDLLGGVEVFVAPDLNNQRKQIISSASGWQTLDGEQVKEFIIQDSQNNKIERIQQQQILIEAIRQRLHHPSFAANLTQTVQTLHNYLDTDLTLSEIKSLLSFLHQLERDEITVNLIPNYDYQSKYAPNNFIIAREKSDRKTKKRHSSYSGYSWHNIPIAIQNTTNSPELSLRVLEYLIGRGFYNVYLHQHSPLQLSQTEIIAQPKDLIAADYLQQILSIGKLETSSVKKTDSELTIRLGEDAKFIFLDDSFIK